MSTEEKEPYFDGPLVTPPHEQAIFYPNNQRQPLVPMAGVQQPSGQPAPAFYNPANFAIGGAGAPPWEAPVQQQVSQPFGVNRNIADNSASVPAVAQPYFGGFNPMPSASSSAHTTPERNAQQPQTDVPPFNVSNYEPQLYTPHASSLFTPPGGASATPPSGASANPPEVEPVAQSAFSTPNQQTSNSDPALPPPQQGHLLTPASSLFMPGPNSNVDAQNYMNPVPHSTPMQQSPFFVPNVMPDMVQTSDHERMGQSAVDSGSLKNDDISLANPMDLHNGSPGYSLSSADQSYMNMAYSHSYSGRNPPQNHAVSAYVAEEFQMEANPMISTSSSGHDYDILHSQGTWRDQNILSPDNSEYLAEDGGEGSASGFASDNIYREGNIQVLDASVNNATGISSMGDTPAEIPPRESSESIPLQVASGNESLATEESARDPLDIDPMLQASSEQQNSSSELHLNDDLEGQQPVYLKPDEGLNLSESDTQKSNTLSLDYDGDFERNKHTDLPSSEDGNKVQNANDQQSYNQLDAAQASGDAASADQETYQQQDILSPSAGVALEGYAVGGSASLNKDVGESMPESPIPADGLHPKQPILDRSAAESPHHFASPNSAFESRIRSQSDGSNISNTSSQKSTSGVSNRATHNRPSTQQGATSSENTNIFRENSVPTSGPFSTEAMHSSSHTPDSATTTPSVRSVPITRAAIPDIVRPLPNSSSDENLRTGATMIPFSSNQSLHSQVLTSRTAYPPEPRISASQASTVTSLPGRTQPDLIQSPPEAAGSSSQLRTAAEVTTIKLKTSEDTPPHEPAVASSTSEPPPVRSDPYLSRSLHNTDSGMSPSLGNVDQSPLQNTDLSVESSLPPTSAQTDDIHHRDMDYRPQISSNSKQQSDEEYRHRETYDREQHYNKSDLRRDSRDPRWEEDRHRQEDDYRRRPSRDDEKYKERWDARDDRYKDEKFNDSRSRHDHHSRPSSRQSGYAYDESYHDSRYYDGRSQGRDYRDSYYRDRYWGDRYPGYERRDPYYGYDDRRGDRYYDYHRHHGSYYGHDPRSYDQYAYDSYYGYDYPYQSQRRQDDEDSRSVYSERSRTTERDHMAERDWRQEYEGYYDSRYDYRYAQKGYDDSIADESTLSGYDDSWRRLPTAAVPARQTPVKFSSLHTIVRFGPGGQLIKVRPNRPTDNQPTTVEIHSLEVILQDTKEAEDLRSYPGPLSKDETHKNDVLQFVSTNATESLKDMNLMDRQSTSLIWEFLGLLVRQNGSVLGTDIAELLTKDHTGDFTLLQSPLETIRQRRLQGNATPTSVSDDVGGSVSPAGEQAETKSMVSNVSFDISTTLEKNCHRFRDLLLHGRKKDALEWAMKSGLWGHALLLASKTDSRTHAQVMLRFANSLPINDPLQTVYQLMSGRQPAAATCVSEEGWGDWRPHLAMILSNPTSNPSLDMRAVLTMGDTLSTRGLLHASHFCYLMSSTPLGYYGRPSSKMVLLGGNHMLTFNEFAKWESIRRTEIYEYAISLGKQQKPNSASVALPSFQIYKFIYACKLAEYGLVAQALHYCERIAKAVCKTPTQYSPTLVNQLVNVSDQLRYHDPQIQAGVSQEDNLKWLEALRSVSVRMKAGSIVPRLNVTSSVLTNSNTPSIISSSPSAPDDDEIQFSAHTPDLEDGGDAPDSGYVNDQASTAQYGNLAHQQHGQYSGPTAPQMQDGMPRPMVPIDAGSHASQVQTYSQDQPAIPTYNVTSLQQPGGFSQQPLQGYMQPSAGSSSVQTQHQVPSGDFSHLANQANPLASYSQSTAESASVPYSMPHNYSNYGAAEPPHADYQEEDKGRNDFYDQMGNSQRMPQSNRSRTTSQGSQRSWSSAIKHPTTMNFMTHTDKHGRRSRTTSEASGGRRSRKTSGEQAVPKPSKEEKEDGVKKSGSWLFSWLPSRRKSHQVHLPDDKEKEIVWDNDKKKWVNKNGPEEESAPPPPPPSDNSLMQQDQTMQMHNSVQPPSLNQTGAPETGPPQMTANRFSLKNLGGNRSMYKNAFSTSSKPAVAPAPMDMPGMQNTSMPQLSGFMIPSPAPTSQPMESRESAPAPQSTPMHPPDAPQSIQMFTPGNTPHGSSNDFTQPFNHAGSGDSLKELNVIVEDVHQSSRSSSISSSTREVRTITSVAEEEANAPSVQPSMSNNAGPAGPTMFFNPSQFVGQPDILSQPSLTTSGPGRGNPMGGPGQRLRRGRGRAAYPGRT